MNTATAEYAAGAAAARQAIAILEPTMGAAAMRVLAAQNIIPIHHSDRSNYDHGASDAWGDWQAASRKRQGVRR